MPHTYCYSCNSSFDAERTKCPECRGQLTHYAIDSDRIGLFTPVKTDTETIIEQNARIIELLKLQTRIAHNMLALQGNLARDLPITDRDDACINNILGDVQKLCY
jgi:hypothetical protein